MKRLLVVAAIALSAGSALAADLPSRKGPPVLPPPPPPPPMWTGFYVGLNAGYGFGTSNSVTTVGAPVFDALATPSSYNNPAPGGLFGFTALANAGRANINQNGFIGGGQVGYNWQYGTNIVIGLEADIQGATISGSGMSAGQSFTDLPNWYNYQCQGKGPCSYFYDVNSTATGVNAISAGVDWMGTVRGRLGYLVMPTLLVYATGGLSYGGVHANAQSALFGTSVNYAGHYGNADFNYYMPTFGLGQTRNQVNVGWNAGGGLEWMFMPNWSAKAEAFYYDLGSVNLSGVTGAVDNGRWFTPNGSLAYYNVTSTRVNYQGVVARAGVNYHFNWFSPAPVIAKY